MHVRTACISYLCLTEPWVGDAEFVSYLRFEVLREFAGKNMADLSTAVVNVKAMADFCKTVAMRDFSAAERVPQ